MTALCLDHLSLCDVPALELVEIAGTLECAAVSLFVTGNGGQHEPGSEAFRQQTQHAGAPGRLARRDLGPGVR